jgi:hypothetical protein
MGKSRKPGDYTVRGQGITDPVTTVRDRPGTLPPGTPSPIGRDNTPVQPIVVNLPAPKQRPIDIWHLIAAIVVAVVLSSIVSITIAIAFRTETLDKIDKVEQRVDTTDQQIRVLDTTTTRIEARLDNER